HLLAPHNVRQAFQPDQPAANSNECVQRQAGKPDVRQDPDLQAARESVLAAQRDDGGWAQLAAFESDAYATGQTLVILRETGLSPSDPAYQRVAGYLLKTQCEDGSWLVKTRSQPIQVYFDNGDPHGEHQFISIPATSWAVAALAAGEKL